MKPRLVIPTLLSAVIAASFALISPRARALDDPAAAEPIGSFRQEIPGAAFAFEMRRVPGSADGSIKPFWIGVTEITWEAADAYIYKLDEERGTPIPGGADAVTRPSKPYLPPDRGFGHDGFPAITMSFQNAKGFCEWLSAHSGRKYRLPTEAEWEHACLAGADASAGIDADESAWHAGNSGKTPHAVAQKRPNAWGLFDMLGNVQEWCVAADGTGVTRGGSYLDDTDEVSPHGREEPQRAWNASDPQIPKSVWWLADAPFVGFRVVCEDVEGQPAAGERPDAAQQPRQP